MADRDGFDMPPTSIAALQALSIAARRGEPRAPKLTPGALKLLEQLLAAPELAATLSISALANQHGVNASSLTRLSHALACRGSRHFKRCSAPMRPPAPSTLPGRSGCWISVRFRVTAAIPSSARPCGRRRWATLPNGRRGR